MFQQPAKWRMMQMMFRSNNNNNNKIRNGLFVVGRRRRRRRTMVLLLMSILPVFVFLLYRNFRIIPLGSSSLYDALLYDSDTTSTNNNNRNRNNQTTIDHHHHYYYSNNNVDHRNIVWKWQRFSSSSSSSSTTTNSSTASTNTGSRNSTISEDDDETEEEEEEELQQQQRPTVLISQYDSGLDPYYTQLFNISNSINVLYAKKYHYDYVSVHGIAFRTTILDRIGTSNNGPKPSRSTYNKIILLQAAIDLNYDYLLSLDSDAILYDFTRQITDLVLPKNKMVMAQKVYDPQNKNQREDNVNIGVLLWNLRHPMIRMTVLLWKTLSMLRIIMGKNDNDQKPLQYILRQLNATQLVHGTWTEFASNGHFVKHFIRHNSQSWRTDDVQRLHLDDDRVRDMQSTVNEICQQHHPLCPCGRCSIGLQQDKNKTFP